ncbi:MAG: 16S rRNA (guanine(527)-N(7))-methyltransferase RsmG [Nitrospirae bacterium]|nr:MAG: 16S rRNA (guanine(527)-N(7))-methyltransferase RsmG [Nitrospirota bacterium]
MSSAFEDIIKGGAANLGIDISPSKLNCLLIYFNELKRWSKAYNLTALREEREIALRLFLDSLSYHVVSCPYRAERAVDVGSGAGFPGLVMALFRPETEFTLIEPSKKKSAFLRNIVAKLSLKRVSVFEATLEEFVSSEAGEFSLITTRALFSAKELLKKTLPIQSRQAVLILSKGKNYREELKELEGLSESIISSYRIKHQAMRLPSSSITRNFIIIERTA